MGPSLCLYWHLLPIYSITDDLTFSPNQSVICPIFQYKNCFSLSENQNIMSVMSNLFLIWEKSPIFNMGTFVFHLSWPAGCVQDWRLLLWLAGNTGFITEYAGTDLNSLGTIGIPTACQRHVTTLVFSVNCNKKQAFNYHEVLNNDSE